jgi:Uma2 family endonuclease
MSEPLEWAPVLRPVRSPAEQAWQQELLDGQVVEMPPPTANHQRIAQRLHKACESHLNLIECSFRVATASGGLADSGCQRSATAAGMEGEYFAGAPMIAVEVISPSSSAEHVDKKIAKYLNVGATEVWVLFPETPSLQVCTRTGSVRVTEEYRTGPLQGW